MKEATIYDIAKELDLSASTVSRALNNNPLINEETRKKVQLCAEQMGYRANAFASNLRMQKTNTIGVIVPRLDSNFMSACLAGMEEAATAMGYNMIISQSHESLAKEAENANNMFNKRVDGLIASLTIDNENIDHFQCFSDKEVPVVYFDRVPENSLNACFVIDNYKAGYMATKHLIDVGCKHIAHLTLKSNSNVYRERLKGFYTALEEDNNCGGEVYYLDTLSLESGINFISEYLKMPNKPDGLFVANDLTAVGCILELQKNNIRVPGDVAIVGFNNDPVSTIIKPQLTTVDYPGKEAGMLAARSLIEHLNGEQKLNYSEKVVLNANLIERDSTKRQK